MSINYTPRQTAAFYGQAIASFVVSTTGVMVGIAYLDVDRWQRAFLALGLLYVVTSSLTLAKVVRDQHEASSVVHRVDEARLERFLTDHDMFLAPPVPHG